MKILISGYYGFGNVGDEAVLQSIIQGLRQRDAKIEITVLSAFPGLTKETYKVDSIYRYNWLKIVSKMSKTDLFISGGGTLFQNITSNRSFIYYIGLVLLAKLFSKKAVIFAQGFGPLKRIGCRFCTRLILNQVDLITLRDKDSFEELKKLGINNSLIHVTGDPTAILETPPVEKGQKILELEGIKKSERPLLGIAIRCLPKEKKRDFEQSLAKTFDWLSKEYNYYPVFILFMAPSDVHITSGVGKLMKRKSDLIFRVCKPDEMLALISQLDLLIGMRLHSLIFAAMNAVPMLGLSYDPKVESFMKSVQQPYLNIDKDMNFESLRGKLNEILSNKENIRAELKRKKKELYDKAALNFELLYEHG